MTTNVDLSIVTAEQRAQILENGAVFTKHGAIVDLELEGDTGLFLMSNVGDRPHTAHRSEFETKAERDEALLNTVGLYLTEGWTLLADTTEGE